MENKILPEFTIIWNENRAVLIDPKSKVCLGVSKKIAENLENKSVQEKLYPIWKEQVEWRRKIDAKHNSINTVYLMVTRLCNMNCEFCAINANHDLQLDKELKLSDIQEGVIPLLREISPHKLIITGGEPLIKDKIEEIIAEIYKNVDCPIVLQSNGLLLKEQHLTQIAPCIKEINFSTKHMFESREMEEQLRKNIKSSHNAGIKVLLSFIYDKTNKIDLFKLLDIAAEFDLEILINFVTPIGRAKENSCFLTEVDIIEMNLDIAEYILAHNYENKKLSGITDSIMQIRDSCGAYGKVMAIFPEGNIYMCQCLENENFCLGNVKNDSPEEIRKHLMEKLKQENIKKTFCVDYKSNCRKCDYKYFCAGKCPISTGDTCHLLKEMINYQLFYKRKTRSRREDLEQYVTFLRNLH